MRNLAAQPGELRQIIRYVKDSVFGPICENMTSSTKPEVHNVLHCRQRRTERRHLQKMSWSLDTYVVLRYASRRTDLQAYRHV